MAAFTSKVGSVLKPIVPWRVCPCRSLKWRPKPEKEDFQWARPLIEKHLKERSELSVERKPTKLHMVWRTKTLVGRPYWEKETIKTLGLDGKMNNVVIHKNTPLVNERLASVLHLVRIRPVTLPQGLPETEEDLQHCHLLDNGQFIVNKSVLPASVTTTTDPVSPHKQKWKLNNETLNKKLRRKLETYKLQSEYFRPNYRYKYNQDGKEFRYFGDTNVGADKEWF